MERLPVGIGSPWHCQSSFASLGFVSDPSHWKRSGVIAKDRKACKAILKDLIFGPFVCIFRPTHSLSLPARVHLHCILDGRTDDPIHWRGHVKAGNRTDPNVSFKSLRMTHRSKGSPPTEPTRTKVSFAGGHLYLFGGGPTRTSLTILNSDRPQRQASKQFNDGGSKR